MYCGNLESVRESDIIIFETELDLKKMGVNLKIRYVPSMANRSY